MRNSTLAPSNAEVTDLAERIEPIFAMPEVSLLSLGAQFVKAAWLQWTFERVNWRITRYPLKRSPLPEVSLWDIYPRLTDRALPLAARSQFLTQPNRNEMTCIGSSHGLVQGVAAETMQVKKICGT